MRVLGVDLGSHRIGLAVSDALGILATPHSVITRSGDPVADRRALLEVAEEVGAGRIIVGLPLSLDGSLGPAARAALAEVDELERLTSLPVEPYDERLTTVTADRSLREMRVRGARRREVVDQVAAAVMLQAWLDGRPATSPGDGLTAEARHDRADPETTSAPSPPRRRRSRRPRR